jgi:hypothetical protein
MPLGRVHAMARITGLHLAGGPTFGHDVLVTDDDPQAADRRRTFRHGVPVKSIRFLATAGIR